eukprot:6490700-Amphidinium_carterae.1
MSWKNILIPTLVPATIGSSPCTVSTVTTTLSSRCMNRHFSAVLCSNSPALNILARPASAAASTNIKISSGTGVNMNATEKSPVRISCEYMSAQAISILMLSSLGVAAYTLPSTSALAFLNCRATYLDLTPSPLMR